MSVIIVFIIMFALHACIIFSQSIGLSIKVSAEAVKEILSNLLMQLIIAYLNHTMHGRALKIYMKV